MASIKISRTMILATVLVLQLAGFSFLVRDAYGSNPAFGGTLNLSNNTGNSAVPRIATSGNNVYAVWQDDTIGNLGNPEILIAVSSNNGTSFSSPASGPNLSNSLNGFSTNPQIAASGNSVFVVWQDNVSLTNDEIFFRASTDGGANFGTTQNLSSDAKDSTMPQVASVGNRVYVSWESTDTSGPSPRKNDILFTVSTNSGASGSFSTVKNLSNNCGFSRFPQMAAIGNNVYVTWADDTNSNQGCPAQNDETFFVASNNNGTGFGAVKNLSLNTGASNDQQITAVGNNVYVVWADDTVDPFFDIMFARSIDSGGSFGTAIDVSNTFTLSSLPIISDSGTNVYVAWVEYISGNSEIFLAVSSTSGGTFLTPVNLSNDAGASVNPQILASGSNLYVAWQDQTTTGGIDDIFFTSSNNAGTNFDTTLNLSNNSGYSTSPDVALSAGGIVYVAWEDDTGTGSLNDDVFFRASTNVVHDVAVTGMVSSKAFVYAGVSVNPINVNVTVTNLGTVPETFTVTAKANTTVIGTQTVTNLAPAATTKLTFSWNTNTLTVGNYTLTAQASTVSGEVNVSNNSFSDGILRVKKTGDVDGNGVVNIDDVLLTAVAWGGTYNPNADINGDGTITLDDVLLTAVNWK